MNRFTLLASLAAAAAVLASTHHAVAQTTDKAAAKPAAAASKPAAKKPATAKPAPKALPAATPEQLTAADRALKGSYDCDFNQKINVSQNSSQGYVDVTSGKNKYTMKPIITSTGALRMEDVTGRMLLLQIANKSMLMDTKLGQRVVDNCVHPSQKS
ncbi:MAG TPA: hypothetical protein VFL86_24740 [Burkholderiaceae bacterium]|nr:hypothetical protein [Burkholderiaceae bacterium]